VNDPHVERLYYAVASGTEEITYRDPEPMAFTNQFGSFSLTDGTLEIVPAEHFADEDQARHALSAFLSAWEMATDLREIPGTIRFTFLRAQVIDRRPPKPGEPVSVRMGPGGFTVTGHAVTLRHTRRHFPDPPRSFLSTVDVELGYRRWQAFHDGKEPLPGMAYFVLRLLEARAGNRDKAAKLFGISDNVLDTLGRLSSDKGDAMTARKVPRGGLVCVR
jgi:hypothetical protein